MNRKIFLFALFLLYLPAGFSQQGFLPGFIIEQEGDTIHGFIKDRDWIINPEKLKFKKSLDEPPLLLRPGDIDKFFVNNELYISGIVEFETSPVMTYELEEHPDLSFETDTVFLKTLIEGEKSLYHLKTPRGRDNYYTGKKPDFDLLIYKRYIAKGRGDIIPTMDGNSVIMKNNKYLGQLMYYLKDCPGVREKIEDLHYTKKSLMKLFNFYYKCTDSKVDYRIEIENERLLFDFGILAGGTYSVLDLESAFFSTVTDIKYNPSRNFTGGIFFDIIAPGNFNRWALHNELLLMNYTFTGRNEDIENEENYRITDAGIGMSCLKINTTIRFTYPIKNFKIYLNAGMANAFSFNETNYSKTEVKFYSTEKIVEEELFADTRKHEQCFLMGSGIRYGSFMLEARYELGNGMSAYTNLNSTIRRYSVLLGYSFGGNN